MTYEECRFHIISDPEQGGNYKFEYLKTYPGFFGSYLKYMKYLKEVADEIKNLKKRDYFAEDRIKIETENKYFLNYMREISQKGPADYKRMESILKLIKFNDKKLQNIFNKNEAEMIRSIEDETRNILETEIPEKTRNQLLKIQENIDMLIKEKYGRQINDLRTSTAKMILIRTKESNESSIN